jgi:hypothetical protein
LSSNATFLYQDGNRYWYSTQPTVTKLAEDRAELLKRDPDKMAHELDERLRTELNKGRDLMRIHQMPRSSADVPDDLDARLVVLASEHPYSKEAGSEAEMAARRILESRGTTPRLYRNTLVFLAADKVRLQDLDEAVRKFLAWKSILAEKKSLNLDPHQEGQAETQRQIADSAVTARVPETYQWLLVPEQVNPQASVTWQAIRLPQGDALVARAHKRLRTEEFLLGGLGPIILRKHLDEIPLWSGDHVEVRQLVEHFARYPYLPRIAGPEVLVRAIRDGLTLPSWSVDSFAYAESYDEIAGRYRGLRAGQAATVTAESAGMVVKAEVAQRQIEADAAAAAAVSIPTAEASSGSPAGSSSSQSSAQEQVTIGPIAPPRPRRFHGTVRLDPARVGRDASRIADEVIAHLAGQVGAEVTITLEIEAFLPDGASEQIVRTVTENGRTLKFDSQGFERE